MSGKIRCHVAFTVKEGEEEPFLSAVARVVENSKVRNFYQFKNALSG
jgi:hypothetical protein